MKAKDLELVIGVIGSEGFDYSFRDYSSFDEVKDKEFHKLRNAYKNAANKLENFLREQAEGQDLDYDELLG